MLFQAFSGPERDMNIQTSQQMISPRLRAEGRMEDSVFPAAME